MYFGTTIRAISMMVVLAGGISSMQVAEAGVRMCGVANSCGVCCYGNTYEDLSACCVQNGCVNVCEPTSSFCCFEGYEIDDSGCW